MKADVKEITINGVEYVEKNSLNEKAIEIDGMKYVIVRTCSAGVFAGYLKERSGQDVTLIKARRIWRWYGAASLSQLAMEGTSKPSECKFPCEVSSIVLTQAIEIIPCTKKAQDSIASVAVWAE